MTIRPRRWLTVALAPLMAATLLAAPATPANAEPDGSTSSTPDEKAGESQSNLTLNQLMESANRKFVQARNAVTKSTKTQQSLAVEINLAEAKRNALEPEVNAIAAQQYRTGNIGAASFLLGSRGSDDFLRKAVSLEEINALHDRKLRELNRIVDVVNAKKKALDAEIRAQQSNLIAMRKQKETADKALSLVGGKDFTDGLVDAKSRIAAPAPRDSDGDFSPERCKELDPTTGDCVTARTLHMYNEVKKAGFKNFVGCHRNGGPFEHPKGRACDWSLQKKGFAAYHNQTMRRYGNDLMAFLVRNADRLGIYYVIWDNRIWFPATGWKGYRGASTHEDHVHVSML